MKLGVFAVLFATDVIVAGVSADAVAKLRFGAVEGNDCAIKWDGTKLEIPQHTDTLADATRRIDALETWKASYIAQQNATIALLRNEIRALAQDLSGHKNVTATDAELSAAISTERFSRVSADGVHTSAISANGHLKS